MSMELLEPGGVFGMALNLEEDNIGCVILGPISTSKATVSAYWRSFLSQWEMA